MLALENESAGGTRKAIHLPLSVSLAKAEMQPIPCPSCEQPTLRLVGVIAKPSWDKLLNRLHEDCPA